MTKLEDVVFDTVFETTENLYAVQKKTWAKWTAEGKRLFNEVYSGMIDTQGVWTHPKAAEIPHEQWKTICWNAAWWAAWFVSRKY